MIATTMMVGIIASERVIRRRSHGDSLDVDEPFHHHLAGQRAGDRRVLPAGQQSDGKQRARPGRAHQRAQQLVGILNGRNLKVPAAIETPPPPQSRMAAFTNSAIVSASAESTLAMWIASRLPSGVRL